MNDHDVTTSRHHDIISVISNLDVSMDLLRYIFTPPTQTRPASTSPNKLQNKNVGFFFFDCSFDLFDCYTNLQERAPFLFRGLQRRSSIAIFRRLHLATNALATDRVTSRPPGPEVSGAVGQSFPAATRQGGAGVGGRKSS